MATIQGTQNYFNCRTENKIPAHAIRTLGKTGWQVACIGFGGYRINFNSLEHAKALRLALKNGFNLIDTSSNYGDGDSEMLIGNLLFEMFERNEIDRDELVVVSKVGYVQGKNLQLAQQREAEGIPFPEMVNYMDDCRHCIHPEFLEDQLSRTLERLQLTALDVYLLHNPEYFLADSKKRNGRPREQIEEEYYRRIKQAFEWMEEKIAEGKIKSYGISSNSFPLAADNEMFTSLERVLAVAEEVAIDNYFQVIQFPYNLLETGAATQDNQGKHNMTLLQLAEKNNLATLANRPLNAMFGDDLVRLANFRTTEPESIINTFHEKLTSLQLLEKQYREQFLEQLRVEIPQETLQKLFSLSKQLGNALSYFRDWEHWDYVKQNLIYPQTMNSLSYLSHGITGNESWRKWIDQYSATAVDLFEIISCNYENQAQERSIKLAGKLKSLNTSLATSATLSQQALRVLIATRGMDCVLLGMRRTQYVEDALDALKADPIPDAEDVLIDLF